MSEDDTTERTIRKLPEEVINRIAAGEVIVRPANAVKELLENSIDAGSSRISLVVREGGVARVTISDNGHGIRSEDLPILCERFTTSKIRTFEDVLTVASFGFRGEALASISHVARVNVTTRFKDDICRWSCSYIDGKPLAPAKMVAGEIGTTITFEDLFYCIPTRRRTLGSPAEEYAKILDVVARYAVHYPTIAFASKKAEKNEASDLTTRPREEAAVDTSDAVSLAWDPPAHRRVISSLWGTSIVQDLIEITHHKEAVRHLPAVTIQSLASHANANLRGKKSAIIIFINNRLVDAASIRKVVEAVYNTLIPKGTRPWVYLRVHLPAKVVDVNVHPSKKDVLCVHEDYLLSEIQTAFETALRSHEQSRKFTVTQAETLPFRPTQNDSATLAVVPRPTAEVKLSHAPPPTRVRVDPQQSKLHTFLTPPEDPDSKSRRSEYRLNVFYEEDATDTRTPGSTPLPADNPLIEVAPRTETETDALRLESVAEMRAERLRTAEPNPTQRLSVLREVVIVGPVDRRKCIVQNKDSLVLFDIGRLVEEILFSSVIFRFGRLPKLEFDPPTEVVLLIRHMLQAEQKYKENDQTQSDPEQRAKDLTAELELSKEMLSDYFGFTFKGSTSNDSTPEDPFQLVGVPRIFGDYFPGLRSIPHLVTDLSRILESHKTDERSCLAKICRGIAAFYACLPDDDAERRGALEEVFFPTVLGAGSLVHSDETTSKASNLPDGFVLPSGIVENCMKELATISQLYRVFERC